MSAEDQRSLQLGVPDQLDHPIQLGRGPRVEAVVAIGQQVLRLDELEEQQLERPPLAGQGPRQFLH